MSNRSALPLLAMCLLTLGSVSCREQEADRGPSTATASADTTASAGATSSAAAAPAEEIPPPRRDSYSLEWVRNDIPRTMHAGETAEIHVTVKNTGKWTWPTPKSADPGNPHGKYAVRAAYRWLNVDGSPAVNYTGARGELESDVPPGQDATFALKIAAPPGRGKYVLQVDLVEELIAWFGDRGAAKLSLPVTVD